MLKTLAVPYIILEILITAYFVDNTSFLLYLLEVLASGFIGVLLIFKFGLFSFNINFINPNSFFSKFGFMFAGLLLMIPGILCDILGILTLIVSLFFELKKPKQTEKFTKNSNTNQDPNSDIIDVEIIEERKI